MWKMCNTCKTFDKNVNMHNCFRKRYQGFSTMKNKQSHISYYKQKTKIMKMFSYSYIFNVTFFY